jgi:hypothetical protein
MGLTNSPKKVASRKYPTLKWGLLTSSFSRFLPPNSENVKTIIDFAATQGYVTPPILV